MVNPACVRPGKVSFGGRGLVYNAWPLAETDRFGLDPTAVEVNAAPETDDSITSEEEAQALQRPARCVLDAQRLRPSSGGARRRVLTFLHRMNAVRVRVARAAAAFPGEGDSAADREWWALAERHGHQRA